jgi:hypothetical protein
MRDEPDVGRQLRWPLRRLHALMELEAVLSSVPLRDFLRRHCSLPRDVYG